MIIVVNGFLVIIITVENYKYQPVSNFFANATFICTCKCLKLYYGLHILLFASNWNGSWTIKMIVLLILIIATKTCACHSLRFLVSPGIFSTDIHCTFQNYNNPSVQQIFLKCLQANISLWVHAGKQIFTLLWDSFSNLSNSS